MGSFFFLRIAHRLFFFFCGLGSDNAAAYMYTNDGENSFFFNLFFFFILFFCFFLFFFFFFLSASRVSFRLFFFGGGFEEAMCAQWLIVYTSQLYRSGVNIHTHTHVTTGGSAEQNTEHTYKKEDRAN